MLQNPTLVDTAVARHKSGSFVVMMATKMSTNSSTAAGRECQANEYERSGHDLHDPDEMRHDLG
jgi:hypothetical protein